MIVLALLFFNHNRSVANRMDLFLESTVRVCINLYKFN